MKSTMFALALAAVAAAVPAYATTYTVDFTGTVSQTQGSTGEAAGSMATGHFDLNDVTGNFLDFTVAGQSIASGYESVAAIGPALTDAIYTAQLSPLSTGSSNNSTFSLDLSSLTTWPTTVNAYTLLSDKTQLATNLDLVTNPASAFPSTFRYYTANADGTDVVSLNANLTSIAVTATPEPATLALLVPSLLGLGMFVRRRRSQS